MQILTSERVAGREIAEVLGLVCGSVVTSRHLGKDFMASVKTIGGGEIKGYTEMLEDARRIALERMEGQAKAMGADAVVAMRLTTSSVMQSAAEVTGYGTAVKLK